MDKFYFLLIAVFLVGFSRSIFAQEDCATQLQKELDANDELLELKKMGPADWRIVGIGDREAIIQARVLPQPYFISMSGKESFNAQARSFFDKMEYDDVLGISCENFKTFEEVVGFLRAYIVEHKLTRPFLQFQATFDNVFNDVFGAAVKEKKWQALYFFGPAIEDFADAEFKTLVIRLPFAIFPWDGAGSSYAAAKEELKKEADKALQELASNRPSNHIVTVLLDFENNNPEIMKGKAIEAIQKFIDLGTKLLEKMAN